MIRRTVSFSLAVLVLAACAGFDPRPQGKVILYGRNEGPGLAWYGVVPMGDPPETVGFGSDVGVACLTGAAGSELLSFDGSPTEGGQPQRVLGRVPAAANVLVLWVDVANDGTQTDGDGVPAWWPDAPIEC